jgi:hypothetical protein
MAIQLNYTYPNRVALSADAMPPAPLYYHPLNFPVNCYDPWSLRHFVKMLVHELRPAGGVVPLIYPVREDGRIAMDPSEVDSKAQCVAIVVPQGSGLFESWPIVPAAMAFGYEKGTPEYDNVEGHYVIYMTAKLAQCLIEECHTKEEEE